MTTQAGLDTADALTTLELTPGFDVTYLPRKIEELLDATEKPLHRAILKNYLRHALLEISGYWEEILVPELTIDEPVYRIAERGAVHSLVGHEAVLGFYREVFETKTNVMAARATNMCVGDFGVVTEMVFAHMTPGAVLVGQDIGQPVDPDSHYLIQHNVMQNFVYTAGAKLIGERVYDDPVSYSYGKLIPSEVVTPEMAREQLAPFLSRAALD
ncbi:hypothetical protein AB0K15_20995 [Amycolatopsis sp. NPDC049253]|uniref:hypothetical protein n=1 Tax=Amycolatopsis sp. NPDC049253 TaxID=3155274 RepID=UPI00342C786C